MVNDKWYSARIPSDVISDDKDMSRDVNLLAIGFGTGKCMQTGQKKLDKWA